MRFVIAIVLFFVTLGTVVLGLLDSPKYFGLSFCLFVMYLYITIYNPQKKLENKINLLEKELNDLKSK